jgi:hypothetical protein
MGLLPNNWLPTSKTFSIDGTYMPEPSDIITLEYNNIQNEDAGRLPDDLTYHGKVIGVKRNITVKYAVLDKSNYDILFNATQAKYNKKAKTFFTLTVPTRTPQGTETIKCYFMSTHKPNCTFTTEYRGGAYAYGGSKYDELHEDVEFSFVER